MQQNYEESFSIYITTIVLYYTAITILFLRTIGFLRSKKKELRIRQVFLVQFTKRISHEENEIHYVLRDCVSCYTVKERK